MTAEAGEPFNPLWRNSLRTRADVAEALASLFAPLRGCFSESGARVVIDASGAVFDRATTGLEGFARPLWGLAAAAMGGADDPGWWPPLRAGLASGTDPGHPDYWGDPVDFDQRLVEIAGIAVALCLAPDRLWEPLAERKRQRLLAYLAAARGQEYFANNWQFFRLLIDAALRRLGEAGDDAAASAAFEAIDSFHAGDGWYRDGPWPQIDHYNGFAFHSFGLIYSRFADWDARRAGGIRERARAFAPHYARWFADDGAVLPFGRSLSYRFACAAFWGACVFAGLEALPWGVMKGLYLRHLRWWARQPIARRDGLLSLGFAYPNPGIAETYSSAASPYLACMAFLPLAVPEHHPFWSAGEAPPPDPSGEPEPQTQPGMLLKREPGQTAALTAGQANRRIRFGAEKYAKFAYSTRYAFSVESGPRTMLGTFDSMLALEDGDGEWHVREECEEAAIVGNLVFAVWRPWRDVAIETWLYWDGPWQMRVHHIRSPRQLSSIEGGFCLPRPEGPGPFGVNEEGRACMELPGDFSGIAEGDGGTRMARVHWAEPNTHLLHPRTLVPQLGGLLAAGETRLVTAVLASPDVERCREAWAAGPPIVRETLPRW